MADVRQLIDEIENGRAVILPTETVYGLFAKALDEEAVNRVYQLKHRPRDKAMNLNVSCYQDLLNYSKEQPFYLKQLFDAFLPGPLTIILKANEQVPKWLNSSCSTIGFRLPNHPITQKIIAQTGPLIGPSANLSGQGSGRKFASIQADFDEKLLGYPDDQALTGQDSTILDLSTEPARILRQGAITKECLQKAVSDLSFDIQ
ncbi:L-threonylcarbamoyladenylate synthase [Streptococcus dentiloxodontae]